MWSVGRWFLGRRIWCGWFWRCGLVRICDGLAEGGALLEFVTLVLPVRCWHRLWKRLIVDVNFTGCWPKRTNGTLTWSYLPSKLAFLAGIAATAWGCLCQIVTTRALLCADGRANFILCWGCCEQLDVTGCSDMGRYGKGLTFIRYNTPGNIIIAVLWHMKYESLHVDFSEKHEEQGYKPPKSTVDNHFPHISLAVSGRFW